MTEPRYFGESMGGHAAGVHMQHTVATMSEPENRPRPSKKAQMLKVLSSPRKKLSTQGGGLQMLPPGDGSNTAGSIKHGCMCPHT